jgi:hypothetical protein
MTGLPFITSLRILLVLFFNSTVFATRIVFSLTFIYVAILIAFYRKVKDEDNRMRTTDISLTGEIKKESKGVWSVREIG